MVFGPINSLVFFRYISFFFLVCPVLFFLSFHIFLQNGHSPGGGGSELGYMYCPESFTTFFRVVIDIGIFFPLDYL